MSMLSNFFGSVMFRLALVFGALVAMTSAAIIIGWLVFQSIAAGMATFTDQSLPALRASAEVVTATDGTRFALDEILIAMDKSELSIAAEDTAQVLQTLRAAVRNLPKDKAAALQAEIDAVSASLDVLIAARGDYFENARTVRDTIEAAFVASTQAVGLLEEASDSAYFDLVLGGDATIEGVSTTLTKLVEEDFALYQATLSIQSEVNLLSGLALSRSQTRDPAMLSIIEDLSIAAGSRLDGALALISGVPATAALAEVVQRGKAVLTSPKNRITPEKILTTRQTVDAALSSALDDINFELVINSEDAKTQNEDSIRSLLDVQVMQIRQKADLSITTRAFFAAVMQVALAYDETELAMRIDALALSLAQVQSALEGTDPEIVAKLKGILAVADPETGIGATRLQAFQTRTLAAEAAHHATLAVREITDGVAQFARAAQAQIHDTAKDINKDIQAAQMRMQSIAVVSFVIAVLAPVLIWLMITRPLGLVTRTTERLANGDLSEVAGLSRSRGEIGRMAAALKVFRNAALETIQLQKQDRERQEADFEAEKQAEVEKQRAAQQARHAKAEQEAQEQARQDAATALEEKRRQAAEADRKVRAEEQDLVVAELAQSLKALSTGDLSHHIETEFPGSYEGLRKDYNAAIGNLSQLIRKIGYSSGIIDASTNEVSAASLDLSRRTEVAAATLEETAASLNVLTNSVALAAAGATEATNTVSVVRLDAESSQTVMKEAVNAMSAIEKSSTEISRIVSVIDEISFQTNLLALNAGVEAARAGEAGRGFAVVASEVRSLAQRCSDAALEINGVISASLGQVEHGVSLIDKSNTAMQKIMGGIADVTRHVSQIAESAEEQSAGITEINSAISNLDRSTQQNAAMFEETTAASQSLNSEATTLAQVVAGFTVSENSMDRQVEASPVAPSKVA